ncbi:MAG: cytochrome P460 family protein [Betaproteobacteria bacterium]|nr:cytochrome P460 family protein [Betaproteobacteria bacterium]
MKLNWLVGALGAAIAVSALAEDTGIAFPDGYRNWFHHRSTVNMTGHQPEGNVGLQHVYANPAALEGLRTGKFADGATFVVDRFKYEDAGNNSLAQGSRKVIAVMVRNSARYPETGGWGFEAFKGGDPSQRVVKDGGKACFACHVPHADNHYLFSKNDKP